MRFPFARALAFALLSSALAASIANAANLGEVNVYSYRQPCLIDPLFKEFTDETGIKVNVIFAEKGLIERIRPKDATVPPMWCARGQRVRRQGRLRRRSKLMRGQNEFP
jgi:iron(III) transport system substrate-binding protein